MPRQAGNAAFERRSMMILSISISVRARRSTADRSSQAGDGERDQGQPVPTRLWLVVKLDNILVARFPLRNGIEPLMFSYGLLVCTRCIAGSNPVTPTTDRLVRCLFGFAVASVSDSTWPGLVG